MRAGHIMELPLDFMPNEEFEARYGGVGSPEYNKVIDDIESRFDTCLLYQ